MTIVLFLDADWQPLRVEPWTRAITDVFLGKVEVIEYSRDRTIKAVCRELPMPAVVRLLRRFRRDRQAIRFSRVNIYTRDAFTCQYCGQRMATEELTFDHVLPRSLGGKTTWENIATCCVPCNHAKANRTPAQARMRLRRPPYKPRHLPLVTVQMDRRHVPEEWRPYWNVALEQ
jgi:5-methylcytosine-specific restriction endonuclease McrA